MKGRYALFTEEGQTVMLVEASPFERCDRCQEPSDELVPVKMPVMPYVSRQVVDRRICVPCCVDLHKWWYNFLTATIREGKATDANNQGNGNNPG